MKTLKELEQALKEQRCLERRQNTLYRDIEPFHHNPERYKLKFLF